MKSRDRRLRNKTRVKSRDRRLRKGKETGEVKGQETEERDV